MGSEKKNLLKKEILDYYVTIGHLYNLVLKASDIDDALHKGLKVMDETFSVDALILWYKKKEESCLRPYFWYGPLDITSQTAKIGEGYVGECFSLGKAIKKLEYKKGDDSFS
ncbi:MAG: hypothetical protein K5931_00105, partial [Lachnospiraceae bacterium]|nr:hypothetical protein [Lachnospiraceae bacterium]